KFLNAGKFYNVDVLIMGGDITGKMIVPLIEQPDSTFKAYYLSREWVVKRGEELEELEKSIRYTGYYPYRTDPKEMEELSADKEKVDRLFSQLMVEAIKRWVEMAEEKLRDTEIKMFVTPGNDDRFDIDPCLKTSEYVVDPEGLCVKIDDFHEMISTGFSNHTPWDAPRECDEEELEKKIEAMASQVQNMENCIFNFHCPPYNSKLDEAPVLDKDFRPVMEGGGQMKMAPAGSTAVFDAIIKHQPMLGLHGHIHESKGVRKLGRTLCVNPGSEYGEGILRGTIITLSEKGIKSYQLTSG
ncbi:MAG: metallophosphoesterase, partial [bacterium]